MAATNTHHTVSWEYVDGVACAVVSGPDGLWPISGELAAEIVFQFLMTKVVRGVMTLEEIQEIVTR